MDFYADNLHRILCPPSPLAYKASIHFTALYPRVSRPFCSAVQSTRSPHFWVGIHLDVPVSDVFVSLLLLTLGRLSYNTYRRGLFSLSDEDYRWAVLRTKISPFLFQVVNLSFIAIIQNLLLLGLAVPAYYAAKQHDSLVSSDLAIAATSLILLVLEFTSDNQQYAFQTYKYATIAKDKKPYDEKEQWPGARLNWTVEDAKRGFITKGLWAYSRHPNFACEQAFWVRPSFCSPARHR